MPLQVVVQPLAGQQALLEAVPVAELDEVRVASGRARSGRRARPAWRRRRRAGRPGSRRSRAARPSSRRAPGSCTSSAGVLDLLGAARSAARGSSSSLLGDRDADRGGRDLLARSGSISLRRRAGSAASTRPRGAGSRRCARRCWPLVSQRRPVGPEPLGDAAEDRADVLATVDVEADTPSGEPP